MSFQVTADGRVQVFVDGCYIQGSSKGGIGVWFNHGHPLNGAFVVNTTGKSSNDVEFMAAQQAINIFQEKHNGALLIYTDSQHVVYNKEKLIARQTPLAQRVDEQHHTGIREAHKLARQGAGIQ